MQTIRAGSHISKTEAACVFMERCLFLVFWMTDPACQSVSCLFWHLYYLAFSHWTGCWQCSKRMWLNSKCSSQVCAWDNYLSPCLTLVEYLDKGVCALQNVLTLKMNPASFHLFQQTPAPSSSPNNCLVGHLVSNSFDEWVMLTDCPKYSRMHGKAIPIECSLFSCP